MTTLQAWIGIALGLCTLLGIALAALRWGWHRVWRVIQFCIRVAAALEKNASAIEALTSEFRAHRSDVLDVLADHTAQLSKLTAPAPAPPA